MRKACQRCCRIMLQWIPLKVCTLCETLNCQWFNGAGEVVDSEVASVSIQQDLVHRRQGHDFSIETVWNFESCQIDLDHNMTPQELWRVVSQQCAQPPNRGARFNSDTSRSTSWPWKSGVLLWKLRKGTVSSTPRDIVWLHMLAY